MLACEAPFLQQKMVCNGTFRTAEEFRTVFNELKKYLLLCAERDRPYVMTSLLVDEVWHQFILFTCEYHAFCGRFFGHYVHHSPDRGHGHGSDEQEGVLEFLRAYLKRFGPVPRIWFYDQTLPSGPPLLDEAAWSSTGLEVAGEP